MRDAPYLLPIVTATEPLASFRQYRNALIYYNHRLKEISRLMGLESALTFYGSWPTWAKAACRLHVPIAVICEGLGHLIGAHHADLSRNIEQPELDAANRKILGKF